MFVDEVVVDVDHVIDPDRQEEEEDINLSCGFVNLFEDNALKQT